MLGREGLDQDAPHLWLSQRDRIGLLPCRGFFHSYKLSTGTRQRRRWRATRQAVKFGVEIDDYGGLGGQRRGTRMTAASAAVDR